MHFKSLALALLATAATAKHVCNSECYPGTTSDCRAAINKMTNTGKLSGNENGAWSSGNCEIEWIPNGVEANAATAHGVAEDLINTCCAGDKCGGTSVAEKIESGCICIHKHGRKPCQCSPAQNRLNCAWPMGV